MSSILNRYRDESCKNEQAAVESYINKGYIKFHLTAFDRRPSSNYTGKDFSSEVYNAELGVDTAELTQDGEKYFYKCFKQDYILNTEDPAAQGFLYSNEEMQDYAEQFFLQCFPGEYSEYKSVHWQRDVFMFGLYFNRSEEYDDENDFNLGVYIINNWFLFGMMADPSEIQDPYFCKADKSIFCRDYYKKECKFLVDMAMMFNYIESINCEHEEVRKRIFRRTI